MTGWTGRDIKNCAGKARKMRVTLEDAGQYIIPLMTSHREEMETLRHSSSGRFLSATTAGVYEYTAVEKHTPTVKITEGRKFRSEGK
jgi:hypothetical protein